VSQTQAIADQRHDPGWFRSIGTDTEPGRPFEGDGVWWRIAPFILGGGLPLLLIPVAGISLADPRVLIALSLVPIDIALVLRVPWNRLPAWVQALPGLSYFVLLALLREAGGGGPSIFDPLVALPVTWFAIYGTGREVAVSVVAMGLTLALPPLLDGSTADDAEQLQARGSDRRPRLHARAGRARPGPRAAAHDPRPERGGGALSQGLRR
jgi:hypothetical protein